MSQVVRYYINIVANNLAQEILDRQQAITTVQNNIDVVSNGLAQEILDRQAGDTANQGAIDVVANGLAQEILDRQQAITDLSTTLGNDCDCTLIGCIPCLTIQCLLSKCIINILD